MNAEELKAMLERLNPKLKVKAIRVYRASFKIVAEDDECKFVRWCHYPISEVEDNPEWWKVMRA